MAASLTVFWQVKGQLEEKPFYELTVSVDKTFYLRGETVTATVQSNASTAVTLSVYGPENKLVYSGTKTTDSQGVAVWSLPISQTASYGTYTFKANVSDTVATTWATVLDVSGWTQVTSFPYIREHKNIRYQIYPRKIIAESLTTGDVLNVSFPYLDIFSKLDVTAYENNMCLRFRLTNQDIGLRVDFTYAFIHRGCKIVINGSAPQEYNFKFKLEHPKTALERVKKLLDGLKVGNVVFDWTDIREAKQAFSFNSQTKELTVHIPTQFVIDPTIFSSDFESGDFTDYDGTNLDDGNTLEVQSSIKHDGSYALHSIQVGSNYHADAWKTLDQQYTTIHLGFWVYISSNSTLSADWKYYYFAAMKDPDVGGYYQIYVGWERTGGNVNKWRLQVARPWETGTSDANFTFDEWHWVEVKYVSDSTNGEVRLYVDDVEIITKTGLDTSGDQIGRIFIGAGDSSGNPGSDTDNLEVYIDRVIVSTEYIGPETAGDTTPPTYNDVSYNATLAGQPCLFSCKWTDDTGLGGYIFSWNASGAWQNDTWSSFSANPDWANVTKTLPSQVGLVIGYRWYANDTSNNWNATTIFTLTTTGYQVTVIVKPNNQRGVLYKANVTVYSGDSLIASQLTNISGQAVFSLPAQTLNFTVYDSVGQKLASVNITVSSNGQEETIIANQNYADASLSWQFVIVAGSLTFSSSPKLRKKRRKEVKTRG